MRALSLLALIAASPALAQEFPLSIETKFGPVTIAAIPERVASVDWGGTDNLLALGIAPLTARQYFEPGLNDPWRPWAVEAAAAINADAPLFLSNELDYEGIAATDPDVIVAIRSGLTQPEYDRLNLIAPVIAVPAGVEDFGLTWDEQLRWLGGILGRAAEAEAEARVADAEARIAAVSAAHAHWQGRTFAVVWHNPDGTMGSYPAWDGTFMLLQDLGLDVHPGVEAHSVEGQSFFDVSSEILPEFDADVILWFTEEGAEDGPATVPTYRFLRAPVEGRELSMTAGLLPIQALYQASALSVPYAAETLAPLLNAALDGDPATPVPQE